MTWAATALVKSFKLRLRNENDASDQEKRTATAMVDPLSTTTRTYFLEAHERLTDAARNDTLTSDGWAELAGMNCTSTNLMVFNKRFAKSAAPATTDVGVQCLLLSAPNATADAEVAANMTLGVDVDAHFDKLNQKLGLCKQSLATPIRHHKLRMRNPSNTN